MQRRLLDSKCWRTCLALLGLVMMFAFESLAADDFGVTIVPRGSTGTTTTPKPVPQPTATSRNSGSLVIIPENAPQGDSSNSFRVNSHSGWHRARPIEPQSQPQRPPHPHRQPQPKSTAVTAPTAKPHSVHQPVFSQPSRTETTYVRPVAGSETDLPRRPPPELAPPPRALAPRNPTPLPRGPQPPPQGPGAFRPLPTAPPNVDAPEPDLDQPQRIPVKTALPSTGQLQVDIKNDRITLTANEAPLDVVLSMIARQHGLSIVGSGTAGRLVTVGLSDAPLEDALTAILGVNGFSWTKRGNILMVAPLTKESVVPAAVQGREVRVFSLSYASASDIDSVVQGLLSPIGRSVAVESDSKDKRRTREQVIVEDMPDSIERIARYVAQADQPPRQVLIEAQVLKVELTKECRHGVNFEQLANLANADITLKSAGFANAAASPALLLGIDGTEMDALIEAITLTTDAKTLARPKVLAVNGQEARVQIGAQLGYFVTTTTQTSTLQNVEFLDVGLVLNVTPIIGDDGQVLMTVKPEVSSGTVNPATGLPEEETTEVETTVLLGDGQGMIIGGLIQEQDIDTQSKIPLLGDLWAVGKLFQRTNVTRERSEIIIALTPRVVPYDGCNQVREQLNLMRVNTPLLEGPLKPVDRRAFEAELPDAIDNPRYCDPSRVPDFFTNCPGEKPLTPNYYFPTRDERQPVMPRPLPSFPANSTATEFPSNP